MTAFTAEDLRAAIERDQLFLLFQPQVDLRTGLPRGVEATLRWQHPTLGVLHATKFVHEMAPAGLDRACLRWILRGAIRELAEWRRQGTAVEYVAVNAFEESLTEALAEDVDTVLRGSRVDPASVEIECQPDTMFDANAAAAIASIRALGVRVALDDFGDGPLRLASLRTLVCDTIKVPVTFVLSHERLDDALIAATVRIARAFDARVVAEGVETAALRERVRSAGCDVGQGYLWSQLVRGPEIPSAFDSIARAATRSAV